MGQSSSLFQSFSPPHTAVEQVAGLTRSHRSCAAMRFDCRTPTEHVQRGSAEIMSFLVSSTHLIFLKLLFYCHQSHPAEEHFLPDATPLCVGHHSAFRFVGLFFFSIIIPGVAHNTFMLVPFQPDSHQQK